MSHFGSRTIITVLIALVLCVGGYSLFSYWQTQENKIKSLETALQTTTDSLSQAQKQKNDLDAALQAAGAKNQSFADQVDAITTNLEKLQRQADTDPELLEKYSKIFFLNENYKPSALTDIDTKYLYDKNKPQQFHDRVWPFLRNLLDSAQAQGVDLKVISAYRSFGTQAVLKSSYKVTYGAGTANSFSADQGYSEHQLGTALDFTTTTVGASFNGFEKTPAYTWLQDNAYKYGFILSYPSHNSYYIYEPWHWRFVGLDLALTLHNQNKNFYDLDQREINTYLANFFNGVTTISN